MASVGVQRPAESREPERRRRQPSWLQARYILRHFPHYGDDALGAATGLSPKTVASYRERRGALRTKAQQGRIRKAGRSQPPPFHTPYTVLRAVTRLQSRALTGYDFVLCLIMTLGSLVVYALTAARTVTGEDAGELIAAAHGLGVPHPPGYPLWTLFAHALDVVIPVGTVAWRVSLASALPAALANGLLLALALKTLKSRTAALVTAGLFAVSLTHWSQAVIPEVYGLNTLFVIGCAVLLMRLAERPGAGRLLALAAWAGFSLTNHTSAAPVAAVTGVAALAVAPRLFLRPTVVLGAALAGALPLLVYAYLPWASARDPYLDWGNPETWDAFVAHVSRTQYAATEAGNLAAARYADYLSRLGVVASSLGKQFGTPWLLLLAPLGFAWLFVRQTGLWLYLLTVGWLGSIGITQYTNFSFDREHVYAVQIFFIPAWLTVAWLVGGGLDLIANSWRLSERAAWQGRLGALAALCLIPVLAVTHWDRVDRSDTTLIAEYGKAMLDTMEPGALYMPASDHSTFAVMYWQGVEGYRTDVVLGDRYGRIEPDVANALLLPEDSEPLDTLKGDALRAYLERVLIERWDGPVYFANRRDMADVPDLVLEPVGPLFKIMRPDEADRWWGRAVAVEADVSEPPESSVLTEGGSSWASESVVPWPTSSSRPNAVGPLVHPGPPGLRQWERYTYLDLENPVEGLDFTVQMIRGDLMYLHGFALARADRMDDALATWSELQGDLAPLKQIHNNVGSALAEHGRYTEALEFYDRSLTEDPRYELALRNAANVNRVLGRRTTAIALYRRLVEAHPDERADRLTLAKLLVEANRPEQALAEFEALAKADWGDPMPWREAGDLLAQLGDVAKATQAYHKSLERDADQQGVREALARLERGVPHRLTDDVLLPGLSGEPHALSPTEAAWAALAEGGPHIELPDTDPAMSAGPPLPKLPGGHEAFLPRLPQPPDPTRDIEPRPNVPVPAPLGDAP